MNHISSTIHAYLDGELSDADRRELEAWLDEDAAHVEQFVEECRLHSCLLDLLDERQAQSDLLGSGADSAERHDQDFSEETPDLSAYPAVSIAPAVTHAPAVIPTGFVGYFSSGWPAAYLIATVICGIGLTIAAFTYVSQPTYIAQHSNNSNPQSLIPNPSPKATIVARITGTIDCRWQRKGLVASGQWPVASKELGTRGSGLGTRKSEISKSQNPQIPKTLVYLGDRFMLSAGLMEITYNTGAKVILQGPCTFEVDSADGGFLSIGKLTARVESGSSGRETGGEGMQNAKCKLQIANCKSPNPQNPKSPNPSLTTNHYPLFTIKTPTATVTDLGTEFGVAVDASGATSASVFQGVVEVRANGPKGLLQNAIRLSENESVAVEQVASSEIPVVRRIKNAPSEFVRAGRLSESAEESKLDPFRRWQTYSEQLRRDPSLMAYYDFQRQSESPTVLRNVAANGDRSLDGQIENSVWVAGRMPGKQAIEFRSPGDCVRLNLSQWTADLTLAMCVRIDRLKKPRGDKADYECLLMSDGLNVRGQVHWQVRSDGRMGFLIYGGREQWQSVPVFDSARVGRWTHLAAVYDSAAGRARLYVDGRVTDDAAVPKQVPVHIGPALIGLWWDGADEPRNLLGRIDELAIFNRPLRPEEIQRMFEAGNPAPSIDQTE